MKKIVLMLSMVLVLTACMGFLLVGLAKADNLLYVGPTFTHMTVKIDDVASNEGGGSVDPSSLNGVMFEYLYCIDLFRTVNVPGSYPNTVVTNDGTIYGVAVNNADKVAWLLSHYGTAGQGDQAYALQAAIWHVVNEGLHEVIIDGTTSSANQVSLYNSYLSALDSKTGNISAFLWITPGTKDSNGNVVQYQGLVGTVPEPGILILLGIAMSAIGMAYPFVRKI